MLLFFALNFGVSVGLTHQEKTDEQFMQLALAQARQAAEAGEVPVGAVLVVGDNIIATARNQTLALCDPTAHAEVLALRAAAAKVGSPRILNATLYVTLEPCLMCCGSLQQARVARLVYGAREPRTGAVVSMHETLMEPGSHPRISIVEGVLAEQSRALMQIFFKRLRE